MNHKRIYVPVMRWKKAEQQALKDLKPADRSRITPLLEVSPLNKRYLEDPENPSAKEVDDQMFKIAQQINSNWGSNPIFIDFNIFPSHLRGHNGFHPLESLRLHALSINNTTLFDDCNIKLIPTTGLNRDKPYQDSVALMALEDNLGVCIRLQCKDVLKPTFKDELIDLLKKINVPRHKIDLLIDFQVSDESCPGIELISQNIPTLPEWRSYTIIGGAFTKDLSSFKKNSEHELSRDDWLTWKNQINRQRKLVRLPNFGDYTIQHAIYYPPPDQANYSASIRYTSDNYWVIMRGENVFAENSAGFEQWPANAYLLTERSEYCGPEFSAGDAYIYQMAKELENTIIKNTGNAQSWLRAGINHHLTFVARQIAGTFDL